MVAVHACPIMMLYKGLKVHVLRLCMFKSAIFYSQNMSINCYTYHINFMPMYSFIRGHALDIIVPMSPILITVEYHYQPPNIITCLVKL